ncbi:hypothetical protein JOD82_002120 [Paenibacillus sp. 1182]|nr:hypothetical protein [Paenibacillus sp. 1182]
MSNKIKCASCCYLWRLLPEPSSLYGEYACTLKQQDLYGIKTEDVEDCKDYESEAERG